VASRASDALAVLVPLKGVKLFGFEAGFRSVGGGVCGGGLKVLFACVAFAVLRVIFCGRVASSCETSDSDRFFKEDGGWCLEVIMAGCVVNQVGQRTGFIGLYRATSIIAQGQGQEALT